MYEQPLFAPAVVAISLSAVYDHADGWRLVIADHAAGEPFEDRRASRYTHLSTAEVLDVMFAELGTRLSQL